MTTIYVIGDSFSAGAELEDHTFESYKKINPKTIEDYVKWLNSKEHQNELKSRINYDKFDAEYARSWPTKLQSLTNATVINNAIGGSGTGMWRAKVVLDFLEFSKSNTTIDIAIIQITEYNRTCLYSKDTHNILRYINLGGFHETFGTPNERQFLKSRAMMQDDAGDFFNFLLDLVNIKMSLLHYGVKTIKFVGSANHIRYRVNDNNHAANVNEINSFLNFLEIDFNKISYLSKHAKNRLPGGHFDELAHEKFALELKEILKL
jgi:hypothetical protein